jgi:hypothetical protein
MCPTRNSQMDRRKLLRISSLHGDLDVEVTVQPNDVHELF